MSGLFGIRGISKRRQPPFAMSVLQYAFDPGRATLRGVGRSIRPNSVRSSVGRRA